MSPVKKPPMAQPLLFQDFDPSEAHDLKRFTTDAYRGVANREDAEAFMHFFCKTIEKGLTPNKTALGFVAEAFDRYLEGKGTLSQTFGVTRRATGRAPSKRIKLKYQRAALYAVKAYVLEGRSIAVALAEAGHVHGLEKTQMQGAWNRWRKYALFELRELITSRALSASPRAWRRLNSLLRRVPNEPVEIFIIMGRKKWYPESR
jgi:hypothetical protein